eukprot:2765754-Pyramimonas_sp.AAC.1
MHYGVLCQYCLGNSEIYPAHATERLGSSQAGDQRPRAATMEWTSRLTLWSTPPPSGGFPAGFSWKPLFVLRIWAIM